MKINARLPAWVIDSLALALIFTWILVYPLYGPFLHLLFGPNALLYGQIFGLSHGLGLLTFAFLPPSLFRRDAIVIGAGAAIFVVSGVWTYVSATTPFHNWAGSFLGFASAYTVLAWIPRFLGPQSPVLKVGTAMVLANFLLGLSGLVLAQGLSAAFIKAAALVISFGPFGAALLITNRNLATPSCDYPAVEKTSLPNIGARLVLAIAAFAAAGYFTGGLWHKIVAPPLYLRYPEMAVVSTVFYITAVLLSIMFAYRYAFSWLGIISLTFLGIGVAISIIGLYRIEVLATTLLFLSLGFGAMDLFYWLALRTLARLLGFLKAFGVGLGASLLFITSPGIAIEAGLLTGQLATSPLAAIISVCLLFVVGPLLVWLFHPLTVSDKGGLSTAEIPKGGGWLNTSEAFKVHTDEGKAAVLDWQPPSFWCNLTYQEKKVYELIGQKLTDAEIARKLYITRHTVKFHTRNLIKKAGVANRKELPAVPAVSHQESADAFSKPV